MSQEIIQNYKNLIEEKQGQVEKAREVLESQESRKNDLTQKIEEIQASLTKNNDELTKKTSILEQAQTKLAEINTQIEGINAKITSLSEEVVSEDDDLLSLMGVEQSDTNSNQVEIDKLNLELENLASTKNKYNTGIQNFTNAISELNSKSSDYSGSLAKLSEAFNSQDQKNTNITEAIAKAEAKIAFYNEQITLLESLEDDGLEALLETPEAVTDSLLESVENESLDQIHEREEREFSEIFPEGKEVEMVSKFVNSIPKLGNNYTKNLKTNVENYIKSKQYDTKYESNYTIEIVYEIISGEFYDDEADLIDYLHKASNVSDNEKGLFFNNDNAQDTINAVKILSEYIKTFQLHKTLEGTDKPWWQE